MKDTKTDVTIPAVLDEDEMAGELCKINID
jgi:hypothetical protein